MAISAPIPYAGEQIADRVATAVREGLSAHPKFLPSWLFYDEAGSTLFDQITELPEYYLTRTERSIFETHAGAMIARAAAGERLRITELGAGSADKTRLLLAAASRRQGHLVYEPVDVSSTALDAAHDRIERELPKIHVAPRVMDYTEEMGFGPLAIGERRLVLYIGSSIGNFEPEEAALILRRVREELNPGDGILLGLDLAKSEEILIPAYDDAEGVTAAFNKNILLRLNRELGAEFEPDAFAHRAVWNARESRIEMHLESRLAQTVYVAALGMPVHFGPGERIHTENSYKYRPGHAEALLEWAGFSPNMTWTDDRNWFAVCFGQVPDRRQGV